MSRRPAAALGARCTADTLYLTGSAAVSGRRVDGPPGGSRAAHDLIVPVLEEGRRRGDRDQAEFVERPRGWRQVQPGGHGRATGGSGAQEAAHEISLSL